MHSAQEKKFLFRLNRYTISVLWPFTNTSDEKRALFVSLQIVEISLRLNRIVQTMTFFLHTKSPQASETQNTCLL